MALETYPLTFREGRWWFSFGGREATPETIAHIRRADCQVVFLSPEGGSFAYNVDEEGQEVVRLDFGAWVPLAGAVLTPWQASVLALALAAVDEI